jgi:hypothetical protein
VRINQPHISLLEEHQQKLVPEKLQADDHIFEGVSKPNPLDNISLIAEDTDVFEGWIVFSEGEDFSFVGGDGYWSSERGHRDEHVLVVEAVEPLSEGVLGEAVNLILMLSVVEFVPVVVHSWIYYLLSKDYRQL